MVKTLNKWKRYSEIPSGIKNEYLRRVSLGETTASICRDELMPSKWVINSCLKGDLEFAANFKEALSMGYDAVADDCIAIADDGSNDTYLDKDGFKKTNTDNVQRSKLRIWARLELLKKWDPKRYGDLVKVAVAGTVIVEGGGVSALLAAAQAQIEDAERKNGNTYEGESDVVEGNNAFSR